MIAVIILILACIIFGVIVTFNDLVSLQNSVEQAWKGILVELKYRYDLTGNLVATVKAYTEYEKTALENVIKARTTAINSAQTPVEKEIAETKLQTALSQFFAVSEDYPVLKSSENFIKLHESLVEMEVSIQHARRYYNGCVRDYNNKVECVPFNMVASMFGFSTAKFFELESRTEAKAPQATL